MAQGILRLVVLGDGLDLIHSRLAQFFAGDEVFQNHSNLTCLPVARELDQFLGSLDRFTRDCDLIRKRSHPGCRLRYLTGNAFLATV